MDKVEVLKIVILGETEITITNEVISISAPKIILESSK
nr:MAG TPA: hypothetical protein [Caudoviricetes sp.]